MVGLGGLEPPTSRLSGVRSNLLSYRPLLEVGCWKLDVRLKALTSALFQLQLHDFRLLQLEL